MANAPRGSILAFLGGTLAVLALLVVFARSPSLFRRGQSYNAVFDNVVGLNVGDEVRFGGLVVGNVSDMGLDEKNPTRISVTFRVKRKTPVLADTRATIATVGLLGQPYLALEAGRPDAAPLPAGSTLPSDESLSFQDAMNRLARFLDHTDTLFAGFDRFGKTDPWGRLDRTFGRIDTLVSTTSTGSTRVLSELERTSAQLDVVLAHSDRVISTLDTTLAQAGPGLTKSEQDAQVTLHELRTLVSDLRNALQTDGGIEQLVRNVNEASANVARLSERIDRDPTSILRKRAAVAKPAGPPAQ